MQKKNLTLPAVLASIVALLAVPGTSFEQLAYAESDEPKITVKVADHLKNNPLAIKIIEQMELQKLREKGLIKPQDQTDEHQTFINEQREIARERLAEKIDRLSEKYKDFTPKESFARFVDKKPEQTHSVFWGMFDFMKQKVDAGRAAMQQVLDNGGTYSEARKAYFEQASTKRIELIQVANDLNVKAGLADSVVQATFDEKGKLPRFDD